MQSADGNLHLLPALPDVWPSGVVKGLRAPGGFEITEMEWKNAQLIKLVVKSILGGNLRLRVPNSMKVQGVGSLQTAGAKNPNPFYYVEETPVPVKSPEATISLPQLKQTFIYDLATEPGKKYTLINK